MKINIKSIRSYFFSFLLIGCAGTQRDCASCSAESFGANWVVVQTEMRGQPFRCWTLRGVSVSNEANSDGIWWQSPNGNLVHISNNYNRVQVTGENWAAAYAELGITEDTCRQVAAHRYVFSSQPGPAQPPSPPVTE